jgi:hypothetical protein
MINEDVSGKMLVDSMHSIKISNTETRQLTCVIETLKYVCGGPPGTADRIVRML